MTKKFEVFLIFLLVLGAVSARRPSNGTRSANRPAPPRGISSAGRPFTEYDFWCEDNNVENNKWFVHPWGCEYYIHCWDNGNGVETFIDMCEDEGDYFFQDDWRRSIDGIDCAQPNGFECPFEDIFWPPCPTAFDPEYRNPIFHPAQQCDSYYFCV
jgi:hypothetical protein